MTARVLQEDYSRERLADFYKNQSIFITGGTGFMGKVLVEKLLYSCSDLNFLFILVRPKRGKTSQERLKEMFSSLPLFKRLREKGISLSRKVVLVEGDITLDGLNIDCEMKKRLINEVSIVFHCAATLKLESNLADAVEMNVKGTSNVLELAKEMKNLQAFIHLSTAFCQVTPGTVEETVGLGSTKPQDIVELIRIMKPHLLEKITPELIAPHPNTYTFTKALAEEIVLREFSSLPVCIARPSIVCPAFKEPLPGWVDSLNGPIGIMVAAGKGVLRSMYCKKEYNAELIPVDFAINGLLAIARDVSRSRRIKGGMPVYNMTQSEEKTATWGEILEMARKFTFEVPFDLILWFPDGNIRSALWIHKICAFFMHWVPAYFIDYLLPIFGHKRFMVRVQNKIAVGLEVLQYFTTRPWKFNNQRFLRVRDSMCPEDKKEFSIDFKSIDNLSYLKNCILGAREYCLKEPPENLPKARRNIKILYCIDRFLRFLFILFFAHLLMNWVGHASYILDGAEKGLRKMPFLRSFVRHDDEPMQRHL